MHHSGAGDFLTLKYDCQVIKELFCVEFRVKDLSLHKCQEVEQTAREQVTDNAILDQISKVTLH